LEASGHPDQSYSTSQNRYQGNLGWTVKNARRTPFFAVGLRERVYAIGAALASTGRPSQ
jgi:hypothetical protein